MILQIKIPFYWFASIFLLIPYVKVMNYKFNNDFPAFW